MERFCVVCGKTTGKMVRGFCLKHFLEKNVVVFVPERIVVEIEKNTDRIKRGRKWVVSSPNVFGEIIESKIKIKEIEKPEVIVREGKKEFEYFVVVKGKIDGISLRIEKPVLIKPAFVQSDEEMRLKSSYHEAILQIRFKKKPFRGQEKKVVKEAIRMLEHEKQTDALAGISGTKERREGTDLLIGSKKSARKVAKKLAKKYGSKITSSFKVVGVEKTGKEKRRVTYCIRI